MTYVTLSMTLHQLVHKPTRGNNTLDLLLTNDSDRVRHVQVVDGLPRADHDPVDSWPG